MSELEKEKIENTNNQENQKEIWSLAEVKKYVDDNQEELKNLDVDTFVALSNSLEKLSAVETESNETDSKERLDELLNTLNTFKGKFENEEKKNEVQKLIDLLQKEKEDLENLKKEIWEDIETDKDKEAWNEEESPEQEWFFKRNWKKLAIWWWVLTAGILGWKRIKNIRERRKFVVWKIEDLKKQEAYKGMSDRKLKRIAKEEYNKISWDSEWWLWKKLLKWWMIAWWAVWGFFGIKWLYNKYRWSDIEKPEVIPPVKKEDIDVIKEEHQEEIVDFKNSTFKKIKKNDVKQKKEDWLYYDNDWNKLDLKLNNLWEPIQITYKKDIWRVVPDGDINKDGYKELKNETWESIQPNFVDDETVKPEDCEDDIYYLEFDEKKTEVITTAPIVEQLQKAIEENKKRSKEWEEGVWDFSSQRWNVWCVVLDKKWKEIKDRDKLTEDDFNKKVSKVSISSWIGWYDEKTWKSNKFTTDIGLIEEWGKKYFRIPDLEINLEKDVADKSYSALHTMVWLANLTNFCLWKFYWDKSKDKWWSNIFTEITTLWDDGNFEYFWKTWTWWFSWWLHHWNILEDDLWLHIWNSKYWEAKTLHVLKQNTILNNFKKEDWSSLWNENYWEQIAKYLNSRMAQYEKYDEKLTKTKGNKATTENWEELPVLQA